MEYKDLPEDEFNASVGILGAVFEGIDDIRLEIVMLQESCADPKLAWPLQKLENKITQRLDELDAAYICLDVENRDYYRKDRKNDWLWTSKSPKPS